MVCIIMLSSIPALCGWAFLSQKKHFEPQQVSAAYVSAMLAINAARTPKPQELILGTETIYVPLSGLGVI